MKSLLLYVPAGRASDILVGQVRKFCKDNGRLKLTVISGVTSNYRGLVITEPMLEITPSLKAGILLLTKHQLSTSAIGELKREIIGYKNIRQYLLNNPKDNQDDYFVQEYGPVNWARKHSVDPDNIQRNNTGGAVIMSAMVHLSDEVQCLDPDKPFLERIYTVPGSPKPYRKFDGGYHKHCSKCPFSEGCVMCTLK